jgi:hypothetical protein
LPDLSATEPTTTLAVKICKPFTSRKPLSNPASHQPESPEIAEGKGPVNTPAGGVLPGGNAAIKARAFVPVSNAEPGDVNRKVIQVTVTVNVLTAWLPPVVVSTHT